jgi:hypothetical protein
MFRISRRGHDRIADADSVEWIEPVIRAPKLGQTRDGDSD